MSREHNVNSQIRSEYMDLILPDGEMLKRVSFSEAMRGAEEKSLDLVEMSRPSNDKLSVCKMMDYGRMMYRQSKKSKSNKKVPHTKDIKYSFNISDHDLGVRHRKVEQFLEKHYTVRYVLELRGREKYMVKEALNKINENLTNFEEIATWKSPKVSDGRKIEISTTLHSK